MVSTDPYVRRLTIISAMPAFHIPLGIWLLASSYFFEFTIYSGPRMTAGAIGFFVVFFGITRLAVSPPWFWAGWVNVILGIIAIITPFAFGVSHVGPVLWNFVIAGALIVITGVIGQLEKPELREE